MHASGDLGGALEGVPLASAIAAAVEGGSGPDAILFGTSYDGRDVAGRLSAKLDRTALTNNVDLELDGDAHRLHDAGVRRLHEREDEVHG